MHSTLCIKPFVLLLFRCPHGTVLLDMVVWIVWQLVWTSTRQLGWEKRGTLRGRVVLPEVQHWKLVESYGMQTPCECHERDCGVATDLDPGEDCTLGKDAGWYGRRRAYFGWQKSFGERTRKTPKEAQWPDENDKAHRGQTKMDQQRIQTRRGPERESCGDAGESQSSARNPESSLRRNQETLSGLVAGGRVDG